MRLLDGLYYVAFVQKVAYRGGKRRVDIGDVARRLGTVLRCVQQHFILCELPAASLMRSLLANSEKGMSLARAIQ